jgi:hypothetical protein
MDLRYEFEQILVQYGYPVLVIRQDKKLRCSCWSEKRQEADRECPICFGLGWTPIVEKHTTREIDTSVPETLALIARDGKFGGMAVPGRQYYFKHSIQFQPGDLIVDVDWTEQGKPVYTGKGIYEVSHIDPNRFEHGQNIFNTIYCKDQPVQKQIRGIRIAQVNGITNYEIAMQEG